MFSTFLLLAKRKKYQFDQKEKNSFLILKCDSYLKSLIFESQPWVLATN